MIEIFAKQFYFMILKVVLNESVNEVVGRS